MTNYRLVAIWAGAPASSQLENQEEFCWKLKDLKDILNSGLQVKIFKASLYWLFYKISICVKNIYLTQNSFIEAWIRNKIQLISALN